MLARITQFADILRDSREQLRQEILHSPPLLFSLPDPPRHPNVELPTRLPSPSQNHRPQSPNPALSFRSQASVGNQMATRTALPQLVTFSIHVVEVVLPETVSMKHLRCQTL